MSYSNTTTAKYYDCDANNRLKLSAVTRYMQQCSSEQLELLGISVEKLYSENLVFLLTKTCAKIHRMPLCKEELVVSTVPVELRGPRFVREFTVKSPKGEKLVSAITLWLLVDVESHKILRPSAFPYPLPWGESILGGEIDDIKLPKPPAHASPPMEVPVRYSSIDVNGHMNNSYYYDFALDALPYGLVTGRELDTAVVNFSNEARPGDALSVYADEIAENRFFIDGKNGSVTCFEALVSFK